MLLQWIMGTAQDPGYRAPVTDVKYYICRCLSWSCWAGVESHGCSVMVTFVCYKLLLLKMQEAGRVYLLLLIHFLLIPLPLSYLVIMWFWWICLKQLKVLFGATSSRLMFTLWTCCSVLSQVSEGSRSSSWSRPRCQPHLPVHPLPRSTLRPRPLSGLP